MYFINNFFLFTNLNNLIKNCSNWIQAFYIQTREEYFDEIYHKYNNIFTFIYFLRTDIISPPT